MQCSAITGHLDEGRRSVLSSFPAGTRLATNSTETRAPAVMADRAGGTFAEDDMAGRKKTTKNDAEKKVDLPPKGPRNADPLTDAPGAHPIETGVGAAVGVTVGPTEKELVKSLVRCTVNATDGAQGKKLLECARDHEDRDHQYR